MPYSRATIELWLSGPPTSVTTPAAMANSGAHAGVVIAATSGTVAEHFDEHDKRDRALRLARSRGLPRNRCCAIGDSRSDIPLFEALPNSLALNAGPAARSQATAVFDTQNLQDIIPWLDVWETAFE